MKMRLEILIHYAKIRVYMVHGIPRVYICDLSFNEFYNEWYESLLGSFYQVK